MVAALVILHGAVGIASAAREAPGQILHRISQIGIGIEQALGVARITQTTRGAETDLHQAVIAAMDNRGIAPALDPDDAVNEVLGQAVGDRVLGDQRIVRARKRDEEKPACPLAASAAARNEKVPLPMAP